MEHSIKRPIIGITVGDPGGIGPEITVKALNLEELYSQCKPLIIADALLINDAIRIADLKLMVNPVEDIMKSKFEYGTIDVLDMKNMDMSLLEFKKVTPLQGKAAFESIKKIIELAMQKKIDATVTGPISKEALQKAGYNYSGHTEIYADLTGTKDYAMMLIYKDFRVIHVTTHLALCKAINMIKKDRIMRVIELGNDALIRIGLKEPRIAVAGLNPHAGENGLFGSEEIDQITPAIAEELKQGIIVEGPIPSDTIFSKMLGGQYDLVVAMYHDQGHIPIKFLGFQYNNQTKKWDNLSGVNITLGLPIIRTSVDHGVAFDKSGEGIANPQSMIEAIKMAVFLSEKLAK